MSSKEVQCNAMLEKSERYYRSAIRDLDSSIYDRGVSTLYYSAFYSITALMILREESSSKHKHTRAFVNKELVSKGVISVELGRMYNKLMDDRQDADYDPLASFSEEYVALLLEQVNKFNSEIRKIINKHG
ncbi:MAG TPA: HEPN domain-containing protein [Bacilli bacterium]